MNKALISPSEPLGTGYRIAQIIDTEPFEVAQPLYWVDCDLPLDTDNSEFFYDAKNNKFSPVDRSEERKELNRMSAQRILDETDWTQNSTISDPNVSSPYLTNSSEFATYRSLIRNIRMDPPSVIIEWPEQPAPIWSN